MEAIHVAAAGDLRAAGFSSFFVRGYEVPGDTVRAPSREALDTCVLMFEQDGPSGFPNRADLPAACTTVRFPALATNLLWPFQSHNPYGSAAAYDDTSEPGPRFGGNRILLRAIERDWDVDAVVAYYRDRYDDYRVDLARMAEIERERLRANDAQADVEVRDLIADVITEQRFTAPVHPLPDLHESLGRRLFARGARVAPELGVLSERFEMRVVTADPRFGRGEVPIHPGVAADLGLAWYDPAATYHLSDGSRMTHDQYVRAFVESAIANRRRQLVRGTAAVSVVGGIRPPIDGPADIVGTALGMYADSFAAPRVRFELEASAPIAGFAVEAYYPPQQRRVGTIACSLGDASAVTTVEPGSAFELTMHVDLAAGARAAFALTCSETLNMFEQGEGADDRDLGVLVLKLRAIAAT